MKFNPFAENKIPSVSMFAKKDKSLSASHEEMMKFSKDYNKETLFDVDLDPNALLFFKTMIKTVGEDVVSMLLERNAEFVNYKGELLQFNCSNTDVTFLPELPKGLKSLYCFSTSLTDLPKLPNTLEKLECSNTRVKRLPELPEKLIVLYCDRLRLERLPALPAGLQKLSCLD